MPIHLPVPLAKAEGQSIVHPQSVVRVTFLDSCATQSPWKKNDPLIVLASRRTQCKALPCILREGHIWADLIFVFQIVILTQTYLLEPVLTPGLGESSEESAEQRPQRSHSRGTVLQWHEINRNLAGEWNLEGTCMMQYRRELGEILGELAEENNDLFSKIISSQRNYLIKESGKKHWLLEPSNYSGRGEKHSALAEPVLHPPKTELWGSISINIWLYSLLCSLQVEASCVAIPAPNGLIHYSPCKSIRNILAGKMRSWKRLWIQQINQQ